MRFPIWFSDFIEKYSRPLDGLDVAEIYIFVCITFIGKSKVSLSPARVGPELSVTARF
jgi:hypothetical protein